MTRNSRGKRKGGGGMSQEQCRLVHLDFEHLSIVLVTLGLASKSLESRVSPVLPALALGRSFLPRHTHPWPPRRLPFYLYSASGSWLDQNCFSRGALRMRAKSAYPEQLLQTKTRMLALPSLCPNRAFYLPNTTSA